MRVHNGFKNTLFFGDCLDILKNLYNSNKEGFIDLIYIDPPFNSKRNYNVLFESVDMTDTKAQKEAFADTWTNISYLDSLNELSNLDYQLYLFIKNLDEINVPKGYISYICTIAIRIWYMYHLLNEGGSFYLHCDPTMSHYIKLVCDLIFSAQNFQNEITWKRTSAHSNATGYGSSVDIILVYSKSKDYTWNPQYQPYDEEYVKQYYRYKDEKTGKLFMSSDLVGHKGMNKEYEWRGIVRAWRYPEHRLNELDEQGKIFWTKNNFPRYKRFLEDMPGMPLQNIWTDIKPIVSWSDEGLGYPTQKPIALLERIINASSNEGDLVADFFCGCGTTIAAAQKLNRKWLGVDISHLAIKLISQRLIDTYTAKIKDSFDIEGFPKDVDSAKELANNVSKGRLQFEQWIIEVVLLGILNENRTQMGFDGYKTFEDEKNKYIVLIEVKSGNVTIAQFNHFLKTVSDKGASMGIFVCFDEQVTRNMRSLAKKEGTFEISGYVFCDKIQIATVEDLLNHRMPFVPGSKKETFKRAEIQKMESDQTALEL